MTELEILLALRNYLNCNEGELLIKYLCKLMTSDCCKGRDAVEIKGFGSCIEAIINIPNEVEKKHKNS